MPNLNFTTKQTQRVQEAVVAFNARTGETFTAKRWLYLLIRAGVSIELSPVFGEPEQEAMQTRIDAFAAQLTTDMEGDA